MDMPDGKERVAKTQEWLKIIRNRWPPHERTIRLTEIGAASSCNEREV